MLKLKKMLIILTLAVFVVSCLGQSDKEIEKVIEGIESEKGRTDKEKYTDLLLTGMFWQDKDVKTAEKYYLEAAKYNKSAYASIGLMYYKKVSKKKGKEKYVEGWEKGDLESAYELGIIYNKYEKKPKVGEKWWKLAGENGHSDAQYSLGLMYEESGNISDSIDWYKKAAEQGNVEAQYNLGLLYKLRNNIEKAEYWYKKAAEQGDVKAQNGLGIINEKKKNFIEAEKWYLKAIEGGEKNAKFNLADLYDFNLKNNEKAKYWYKKAAEDGNEDAKKQLGNIERREKNGY